MGEICMVVCCWLVVNLLVWKAATRTERRLDAYLKRLLEPVDLHAKRAANAAGGGNKGAFAQMRLPGAG